MQISLRTARVSAGISQKRLAERAGLPLRQVSSFERGLSHPDDIDSELLSHALGVDPGSFDRPTAQSGEGYVTALDARSNGIRARGREPDPSLRPVLDLFCGVGGFSTGFESTGEFEVVGGADLLGDRLDTFCENHSAAVGFGGDIRQLVAESLEATGPKPFVVIGGPPCQGFSSLRPFRNVEWNDPRNNLGEEFCRIVAATQPDWLVFENVVGLITHQNGNAFKSLVQSFEALGYRVSARVLNGANFGLPQRRERLVIVGSRKGKAFDWPQPTHRHDHKSMVGQNKLLLAPSLGLFDDTVPALSVMDAISDLPQVGSGEAASDYASEAKNRYQQVLRNGSVKLTMHDATRHSPDMLNIIRHAGNNINALPKGMVKSGFSTCYSRLAPDEPANTITVNFVHPASNRCIHPFQDRALTPREGARMQSFADDFVFRGSRSQIVKQIGNAVPPLLGKLIAEAILEAD